MSYSSSYDVIIIGGSYAGLSAAMALGRSLRNVLVVDSGKPCNRYVTHAHNLVTQDGKTPTEITESILEQIAQYSTVKILKGKAIKGERGDGGFEIEIEDGSRFFGLKLLFATGKKDLMPDIAGFGDCWGKSIAQCPYCHGYEARDTETGILSNGDSAFELARIIYNWSKKLTVFTNGPSSISADFVNRLEVKNIKVVEKEIIAIEHVDGMMKRIVFGDGTSSALETLYNHAHSVQHCDIPAQMGCEITEHGLIKVDECQLTTVPGIFAAGDNSYVFRALSVAIAAGTKAGALINKELVEDSF